MIPFVLEAAAETVTSAFSVELDRLAELPTSVAETGAYMKTLWTLLEEFAVTYGGRLLLSLILLGVGFKLINFCGRKLSRSRVVSKLDLSVQTFLGSLLRIGLKILLALTALAIMGVPMTSIVAVIGSCGLAIGLALQGSLANIAGGFILLIVKPFRLGDYISTGTFTGTVETIGIFNTTLVTLDNRRVVVPNAEISNATLVNMTAEETRRVDLTFSASYADDADRVEGVLLEVCRKHPLILGDPAPFARLSGHKDSALEYTVRAWCRTQDYWTVYYDLFKDVKRAFEANGITIPFPQLDVHTPDAPSRGA